MARGVPRGERRHNALGAQSLGERKSSNNAASVFFNTVHLLPNNLRFEHGDAKLFSCPGRHYTLAAPGRSKWFCAQLCTVVVVFRKELTKLSCTTYYENGFFRSISPFRKKTPEDGNRWPVAYLGRMAPMAMFKCAPFLIIWILDTGIIFATHKSWKKQMF